MTQTATKQPAKMHKRSWRVVVLVVCVAALACGVYGFYHHQRWSPLNVPAEGPDGVSGHLYISIYNTDALASAGAPTPHVTTYVNRHGATPLADNDIRGFLDGHVTHRWNQPTQSHVRLGRRADNPQYGEYELFRVLHRWRGIDLPPDSTVTSALLRCVIESGCTSPLHVYLYAVTRHWNPGVGGAKRNNLGPPQAGEVWWNAATEGADPWGLPGANFAADRVADADRSSMPLAVAHYQPGNAQLRFASTSLTVYIQHQVDNGDPLQFLMKLSDFEEDLPGARLIVFSGEADDDRNVRRRPHLTLTWLNHHESAHRDEPIMLEYGRTQTLRRIELGDKDRWLATTFAPDESSSMPIVEVRGGHNKETVSWHRITQPISVAGWSWVEIRLSAMVDPLLLGSHFTATIRNTWVTSGPVASQTLLWTFLSPSQQTYSLQAKYRDDYTWTVDFEPNELGRWRYRWTHHLNKEPFDSTVGTFDVVAGTKTNIVNQLKALLTEITSSYAFTDVSRTKKFTVRFTRLERAVINRENPASFRAADGRAVRALLDQIREALGGAPIPTSELDAQPNEKH